MGQALSSPIPECEVCSTQLTPPSSSSSSSSTTTQPPQSLSCRFNHHLCAECSENYIKVTFMDKTFDIGVVPELECPYQGCGIVFREHQIARIVNEETFQQYLDKKMSARDGMILANMRAQLSSMTPEELEDQTEMDRQVLAKQLRSQLTASNTAYQCPQCGFGPIQIEGCWDLFSHHNQNSGGAQIKNNCQNCGFFTSDRNKWDRWDGSIKSVQSIKKKQKETEAIASKGNMFGITCVCIFLAYMKFWLAVSALFVFLVGRQFAIAVEGRVAAATKQDSTKAKTE